MQYKRLRELREDNDLKQINIANLLKITRQQYSLYETGKRDIPVEYIKILAIFYKTSADYIIELTNIREPYSRININNSFNNNINTNISIGKDK